MTISNKVPGRNRKKREETILMRVAFYMTNIVEKKYRLAR